MVVEGIQMRDEHVLQLASHRLAASSAFGELRLN
jgi:hypothetical protein